MAKRKSSDRLQCLLLAPANAEYQVVYTVLRHAANDVGIHLTSLKESKAIERLDLTMVLETILKADLIVADVSQAPAAVSYEIGLAHANGKPVLLLVQEADPPSLAIPGASYLMYDKTRAGLAKLKRAFREVLADFRRSPRHFAASFFPMKPAPLPFIDLEKLDPREFENLCFELLSQIGFSRVEWGKELQGVDAVATIKKKDPDGVDYQELWLISMGLHAPVEVLLEMASDPEYLYRRILGRPEFRDTRFGNDTPITLLIISFHDDPQIELFERDSRKIDRRFRGRALSCRTRVWNTEHLVNLIRQYPQLAQKYFSDEGRAQSRYRKTPEELYSENVQFAERQQALIAALQEEKDKRTRAERDAVWKELSFTAAHKLGNPVFALETDLQALKKRIHEPSSGDAAQVAEEMGSSVEKAKTIIEQFKSLTKAQEIALRPISITPLIQSACRVAEQNGIQVDLKQPEHVPLVLADPGRISECFDELVANSLHWFDKADRKITIAIDIPKKKDLPEQLSGESSYLRVRFADNGCGVRQDLKRKIFDPFFTTYPHGTGLGLSLVERIVRGHGGCIVEDGKPGDGAVFDIYLPIESKSNRKD